MHSSALKADHSPRDDFQIDSIASGDEISRILSAPMADGSSGRGIMDALIAMMSQSQSHPSSPVVVQGGEGVSPGPAIAGGLAGIGALGSAMREMATNNNRPAAAAAVPASPNQQGNAQVQKIPQQLQPQPKPQQPPQPPRPGAPVKPAAPKAVVPKVRNLGDVDSPDFLPKKVDDDFEP